MQGLKGVLVLVAVAGAVMLGACRREVEHKPLKLGAEVSAAAAAVAR
ncbi:MAG: hypothetical protein AB7O43_17940 [Hyphomicrobiaceae bacterium]